MTTDVLFPLTDPAPWVNAREDERVFKEFLESLGYVVVVEPDALPITSDPDGEHIRPDLRIYAIAGEPIDPHRPAVYIELTSADRYTKIGDLSYVTRLKNLARAASGLEFIRPSAYLRRKRVRLEAAKRQNPDVIIIMLRYTQQLKVMANPKLLENMLWGALHSRPLQLVA